MSADKIALRRQFRAARAAHIATLADRTAAERALAARVGALLSALNAPAPVAGYVATGTEIDPKWVKSVALLPRIGADHFLSFHASHYDDCEMGRYKVPEPPPLAPRAEPAALLVPLLAATRDGHRLGQGAGHYDRWLAVARRQRPVIAIGVAWDVQVADALPIAPHDQRLDWLATPTRLFDCRAGG